MNFGAKDLVAVIALALLFGLLAPYVIREQVPPDVILLVSGPGIAGILAYYFGAHNGNITGLAQSATQLSNMAAQLSSQAIEKRAQPPTTVVNVPAPAAQPPAPAGG